VSGVTLHGYQNEAIQACDDAYARGLRRIAIVMATGLGKTVTFSAYADQIIRSAGSRILVLVHRDELIKQAKRTIHAIAPDRSIGIVKAKRNELGTDITLASVQTLSRDNRLNEIPSDTYDLVIVDEFHHAAAPSYKKILDYFGCFDENRTTRLLGVTATFMRADKLGLADVCEEVVFKRDILFGIRNKFLVDVRAKSIVAEDLNLEKIKQTAGDYNIGDLSDALLNSDASSVIVSAYLEHAADRQALVFMPTVATAEDVYEEFTRTGITAAVISQATSEEDRELIFKKVRAGDIRVLVNCMVLTEGFDMPQLSCVIIGRPTKSQGLYIQMVGRVLRTWKLNIPGSVYPWIANPKKDALVLDLVGATRNKLVSLTDLTESQIEVKEDESIEEAIEREEKEKNAPEKGGIFTGTVKAIDVDLFAASSQAWLQTRAGLWFIPAGDTIVALLPEDGSQQTFTVFEIYDGKGPKPKPQAIIGGVSLELGMAHGESYAEELNPSIANRGASWRKKKNAPPSEAQIKYGQILHIHGADKMTKVQLSDAISVVKAQIAINRTRETLKRIILENRETD
jgi:superfamily II DNA or RNA helicase